MTTTKRVSNVEVEKAVRRIQERDGVCSAEAFVDEARAEDSPIHDLFEWDDAVEAERWRRHHARQIIAKVRITVSGTSTPAHVHVTITKDDRKIEGYAPLEVAMSDAELRGQVFREAAAGLAGWQRRLVAFEQASGAVELIAQAIEQLTEGES